MPLYILGEGPAVPRAQRVVAFGSRAALLDWPAETQVEACMAPAISPGRENGMIIVDILPEPTRLLETLRSVLPNVKTLRFLWTSEAQRDSVDEITAAAAALGLTAHAARIPTAGSLPKALRSMKDEKVDAIFLMPDPALVNATTFAVLKEYARATRIPFLAPTEGLAEKGATATFASPFREIGRIAARAFKAHMAGLGTRRRVHCEVVSVTISAREAEAVGLDAQALKNVDRIVP